MIGRKRTTKLIDNCHDRRRTTSGAGFTFDWQVSATIAALFRLPVVAERKWRRAEGERSRGRGDLLLSGVEERGPGGCRRFSSRHVPSPSADTLPRLTAANVQFERRKCATVEEETPLAFVYHYEQLQREEAQWKYLCIISDRRSHQGQWFSVMLHLCLTYLCTFSSFRLLLSYIKYTVS